MGAPMGVPPSAMASRIATTRPRIAGSVDSCTMLFTVVVKVCADTPMSTSARPEKPVVGHDRRQPAAETEHCGARQQDRDMRLLAPGGKQRAGYRSDRHDR